MRSRTEMMVDRLKDLQAGTPDIEASAVVSVDGLIMASSLPAGVDEDRISAMSAAMLSLGDRIASELQRGRLEQVHIRGTDGIIVLRAIGEDAVLTVLARAQAKLGLIFLEWDAPQKIWSGYSNGMKRQKLKRIIEDSH